MKLFQAYRRRLRHAPLGHAPPPSPPTTTLNWWQAGADLHAKGHHGDEHFEEQRQSQLPQRREQAGPSRPVRQAVAHARF